MTEVNMNPTMKLWCPIHGCRWSHVTSRATFLPVTEMIIQDHMETHHMRDFLETIQRKDTLLHDAWVVIANAGLHRGNWDNEDPEWIEAAERWRDRFHDQLKITTHDTEGGPDVG